MPLLVHGTPGHGRLWCVTVFMVALPALASPLILVPIPEGVHIPVGIVRTFVAISGMPRFWAIIATFLGILGSKRYSSSSLQEILVCVILIVAWVCAGDTVGKMRVF